MKKVRDLFGQRDGINKAIVRVMVMEDIAQPRKTFVLDKGLYNQTREEIAARTPEKFPPLASTAPKNRLGLAQWLVSPENPLTARTTANRYWQMFFGRGLIKSADDLGVQSEFPLHAELVDWLSAEFRDSGWDVKRLCRLIVTSAVYKQSSKLQPGAAERDPENRFLARGPRYRMPAWMIRDQALAASGLLVAKLGGPPVKPYQPAGIWEEATFGNKVYKADKGESLYRRSLYTFWRRIVGPTMFFDTPSRSVCSVKPMRTNTPLHALATLNDVTYVEAARALAQRTLVAGGSPEERVERVFQLVLARSPAPAEKQVLLASLERLRKQYGERPEAAAKLLAVGESPRKAEIDPVEHAVYAGLCLAILNLDEALTKE